ncbi:Imm50 family immunity protein [Siccibacter turicensis]|uniref:Imm50 family immunity protein n=1 Tax=Siccibacter turicensis TaxID=357233 RepID=UPI003F548E9C
MWFEHAVFNEKIKFMFNNELSIENVEVEDFLYYSTSMLRIGMKTKTLPKTTPDKWKKNKFNSLSITLEFGNVRRFECRGGDIGFECTPIIVSNKEKTLLTIENENFYLYCESDFMTIKDISPFLDCRWKV